MTILWNVDDGGFIQMLADVAGHVRALKYAGAGTVGKSVLLPGILCASAAGKDVYTVELSVPLGSIGLSRPGSGSVLRGNATREGPTNGGLSTWAAVGTTFDNPDRFGELYWASRSKVMSDRQAARKAAMEKLSATGKKMVFWESNPYLSFTARTVPDPDRLLNGKFGAKIPCGTRAIAPFMASNLGDRDFAGTFEVKGELAPLVRFREVGFIELKGGIIVPDPIWDIPEKRVLRIRPHETAMVWFDVDSRDLKPGVHKATVTLHPSRSGFNYETFDFELEVSKVTLADREPVAWTFGMQTNVMRDLHRDYGFSGVGVLPHLAFPKDPSGFGPLDALVEEAERLGVPRKHQYRMFWTDFCKESTWTRYVDPKDHKWHYFGSEYWKQEFGRRLVQLRDHMKALGFDYSNWALYTIDEPNGDPEKEGTPGWYAIEGAKFIKSIDPKIRIWTDPWKIGDGYQHHYLKWYDVLCPNFPYIIPKPELCKMYRDSGKEIWSYTVRTKASVPNALRGEFWELAREGFAGPATFYDLYRNSGDGYDSYDGNKVTSDYCTVYRDPRTCGWSVSRRMEAWYEGLVDMRLIHFAQKLAASDSEKAKVRELILLGAGRKMDFLRIRGELLKFCETLQSSKRGSAGACTPNDAACIGKDDADSIQRAVDAAAAAGSGLVEIPPYNARTGRNGWLISRSILLPSSVTVVIDNATLTLADGVYANFFRSANAWTDAGRTPGGTLRDIRIVGRGKALLDGGRPNDLTESTSCRDGRPHVRANSPIMLVNVENFEVSGLVIENHRYWGLCLEYCRHGRVADMRFIARFDRRNQDGIDLRNGCRDVMIENISGQTGDDMIALSAIDRPRGGRFCTQVAGMTADITDITIRNVSGAARGHPLVALRNHNGAAIRDVTIEYVRDTEFAVPCRNSEGKRYAMIRIGSGIYWSSRKSRLGETSRIRVRNLDCNYSELAVVVNGHLDDSSFSGIRCGGRCAAAVSTGGPWWENYGADMRNVSISDCTVVSDRPDAKIFDCDYVNPGEALKNVVLLRSSLTVTGVCSRVSERVLDRSGGRAALLTEHAGVRIREDELTLESGVSSGFAVSEPVRTGPNPLFKTDFYHSKGGTLVGFSVSTAADEQGKPGEWTPFRKMEWDKRIDLPAGGWLRYRIDMRADDGEIPRLMFMRFGDVAHTRWRLEERSRE